MTRPAPITSEAAWADLVLQVRNELRGIQADARWINERIETYRDARDEAAKRTTDQQKEPDVNDDELRAQRERELAEQLAQEEREIEASYEQAAQDRAAELET